MPMCLGEIYQGRIVIEQTQQSTGNAWRSSLVWTVLDKHSWCASFITTLTPEPLLPYTLPLIVWQNVEYIGRTIVIMTPIETCAKTSNF